MSIGLPDLPFSHFHLESPAAGPLHGHHPAVIIRPCCVDELSTMQTRPGSGLVLACRLIPHAVIHPLSLTSLPPVFLRKGHLVEHVT